MKYQMQQNSNNNKFKILGLILGDSTITRLRKKSILIVGAGGIGCQLIKSLIKLPINKLSIIDLDTIQLSNLNRQFYFRKQHIGRSKSLILKQQVQKYNPQFSIQSIQDNIYSKQFNTYKFYSQFEFIISALDNMKARQHLSKNATIFNIPLIDAGTAGYHGQCYTSVRYMTSCHNCTTTMKQEQSFAVCTIRNRPEKSIHCAIYAKNFYQSFFSRNQQNKSYLNQKLIMIKIFLFQSINHIQNNHETIQQHLISIFNFLFQQQIQDEDKNKNYQIKLKKISYNQAIKLQTKQQINNHRIQFYDNIFSIKQYGLMFMQSFMNLLKRSKSQRFSYLFDKDDQDCIILVTCITNLRVYNYKQVQNSRLQYLSIYECKRMLGKIIAAISSTNSIAASLQITQMINLLKNNITKQSLRYESITPYNQNKISSSWISLPNSQCQVCSYKNFYYIIECDFTRLTFNDLQQYTLQNCFSYNRDLYCGNLIIIKNQNIHKVSPNKNKLLNFKSSLINQNQLKLTYHPATNISDKKVQIILIHKQNSQQQFRIINKKQIQEIINNYQRIKNKEQEQYLLKNSNIKQQSQQQNYQIIQ